MYSCITKRTISKTGTILRCKYKCKNVGTGILYFAYLTHYKKLDHERIYIFFKVIVTQYIMRYFLTLSKCIADIFIIKYFNGTGLIIQQGFVRIIFLDGFLGSGHTHSSDKWNLRQLKSILRLNAMCIIL